MKATNRIFYSIPIIYCSVSYFFGGGDALIWSLWSVLGLFLIGKVAKVKTLPEAKKEICSYWVLLIVSIAIGIAISFLLMPIDLKWYAIIIAPTFIIISYLWFRFSILIFKKLVSMIVN